MKYFPQDIDGFKEMMSEIKVQNPDLYDKIINYFKFKEADRKLCALLDFNATERRRPLPRVADDSVVKSGSSRDKGTK